MNIIYVDFKRKVLDQRKSFNEKWDRVSQLDKLICEQFTMPQLKRLMGTMKYIDRANSVLSITKSIKLKGYATEMIKLINEINLEENTIEKVYTSNDVPF